MTTVELQDAGPMLRYTLQLPGCTPERALRAFTSPRMLAQWWGNAELTAVLEPGTARIQTMSKAGWRGRSTGKAGRTSCRCSRKRWGLASPR
jgi:uncharacterized protein YndB with AHSA1/START domain